ncbi:MAG: hypothetical protein WB615_06545 [Candidatus Tumulicola sp.]
MRASLSLRGPYRLDLTVDALRRVPGNLVDIMMPDGAYLRALTHWGTVNVVEVRQIGDDALDVRISGRAASAQLQTVAAMLGTDVDLHEWYQRTKRFPWLERLANELRGVKPPRYPDLWEALCHGIVFQQLSIAAAASIMQRFVERFSSPIRHGAISLHPFPRPETVAEARERRFRSIGLSRMKVSHLRSAARAVLTGAIDPSHIEGLSTTAAIAELRTVRGIGRWSAAVVLLRGFGRLDVFPPTDSGASRSIKLLSSNPRIDEQDVLATLGGVRGMLYFHLLLGRLRGLHSLTSN